MKEIFKNKTICFVGDSIVTNGAFIYNIRSYFQGKKEKCLVYNRGTAGNKAIMAKYILDGELEGMNANYVSIAFGVNDLGIWLYDSKKEVTPEILQKRKLRNDEYFSGMRNILEILKQKGITPIICSPYPVNEMLIEKDNIETVGDNKEKEDYIGPSFYTRATFKNINEGLRYYASELKKIADEEGLMYIPLHEKLYENMDNASDMFLPDGIHYSPKGYELIAKIILEFMGCNVTNVTFEHTPENDELARIERLERRAGYYRRAEFNPYNGNFTENDIINRAKAQLNAPVEWEKAVAQVFFEYGDKIDELRAEIFKRTQEL